ncbi:Uncharacterized membrane protein [Hymenobacter gelipurpurascens]|uniref:Uncharacterized membrane protein n=1 Tax=Hymenobacter gelipurpurascens TaxID=89968 RepID=A0A212UEG6_9BACT|nr:DUF1345 domain-containing protein [Hymenobacter gelipurpurascens]SNC76645.1 Uncharacterized membrane protein [Hymenobacter gelipurpurascens]
MAISIPTATSSTVPRLLGLSMPARMLRVLLAMGAATLCYQLAPPDFRPLTRLMMAWDGFVLSVLVLSWLTIFRASLPDIRRASLLLHPDRTWGILLALTFIGTTVSLLAVVLMLRGLHDMPLEERLEHILVSLVGVMSTWCLLHTMFALHYAHMYFSQQQLPGPDGQPVGVVFAGAEPASYWDFAYFAFVIGMTGQTSDVVITTLSMRRLVLFHSVLSFGFNTAIVALSINVLSGLL